MMKRLVGDDLEQQKEEQWPCLGSARHPLQHPQQPPVGHGSSWHPDRDTQRRSGLGGHPSSGCLSRGPAAAGMHTLQEHPHLYRRVCTQGTCTHTQGMGCVIHAAGAGVFNVWTIKACLEICRHLLTFCTCLVLWFVWCVADFSPEHAVHWLQVKYVLLINQ